MNKIWIRKKIPVYLQVILGAASLLFVLFIWLFVTTIRSPKQKISSQDYNAIVKHLDKEKDKEIVITYYKKENNYYQLKKIKTNIIKLKIFNLLVYSGFKSVNPPRYINKEKLNKAKTYILASKQSKDYIDDSLTLLDSIYKDNNNNYIRKNNITNIERIRVYSILKNIGISPRAPSPNPIIAINVLAHPVEIVKSFFSLIKGSQTKFVLKKSLIFSIWISLKRELIAFILVLLLSLPIGIFMSSNYSIRHLFMPFLVIGTFIPIAALIPLTQAFFGIGELQKIIFLALGMFFVLLGLIVKEMDEVDNIYLQTGYTLGFSQLKSVFFINFPIALPRIWKHFSAIFGLGWGYIIFAEMINSGGSDTVNGIGWLFIAKRRRLQIPEMYAIFFVIIILAFLFSYLFKIGAKTLFKGERKIK